MEPRPRATITLRRNDLPAWLPVGAGTVYLDGERTGHLIGGKARTLFVLPGEHWVGIGIGLSPPASLKLELAAGERIDLACGAKRAKLGDWSRWRWMCSVAAALVLLCTAFLLSLPFLLMFSQNWSRFDRVVFLGARPAIYWLVSNLPFLDPFIAQIHNPYVLLVVIYLVCTLVSAVCAIFSVQFLRRYFSRLTNLHVINVVHVPFNPLASSPGEETVSLTNACVLAAIKARDSRPVRTRSSENPMEFRTATVDDQ